MSEREKVIKGLEYHLKELTVGKTCYECPYCGDNPCEIQLIANAIALLKEQEPRLLTIEEVKAYPTDKALWFEGKTFIPVLPDCRVEQQNENYLGVEMIDTFYDFPLWFDSYNIPYKFGWRCWSSRPTDEQRGAVPWEK